MAKEMKKTKVRVITNGGIEHVCSVDGPLRDLRVTIKKAVLSLNLSMRDVKHATIVA
jgi:hypothetical protein